MPVGLVDLAVSLVDLAVGLVDRVGTGALDVLAKSGGPSLINDIVIAIFVKCANLTRRRRRRRRRTNLSSILLDIQ